MMKECILIAGMHRSGTSALAGTLQNLGVDFGEHLLPAKEGENDLGFYEDYEILALNDGYLQKTHSVWDDIRWQMPELDSENSKDYKTQLRSLLERKFSKSELWCVKDPRLCILMPLWLEVLQEMEVTPKVIISSRHAFEIASSLSKRNGFSFEKSAILILKHYLACEKSTRGYVRSFISYDELLEKQDEVITNLGEKLDINWPNFGSENSKEFLKSNLRHHQYTADQQLSVFGDFQEIVLLFEQVFSKADSDAGEELFTQFDELNNRTLSQLEEYDPFVINEIMSLRGGMSSLVDDFNTIRDLPLELIKTNELVNKLNDQYFEDHRRLEKQIAKIKRQKLQFEEQESRIKVQDEQISKRLLELKTTSEKITELSNKLDERTDWIRKIDKEVHSSRDVMLQMKMHQERPRLLLSQMKLMATQGLKHPQKIIPWISRRVKNQIAKRRVQTRLKPLHTEIQPTKEKIDHQAVIEQVKFVHHESPTLSIVIPVYNDLDYTVACLDSLANLNDKTTYEVIVIDDASPDIDTSMLDSIDNVQWQKNPKNLGFIGACNRGAEFARGEYILFLNNDTVVHEECLDNMVNTFKLFPDAGMVGGKLVYPDGRLQEAGGIVWKDGSAWNFGRLKDPAAPEFNYARSVDYCSGALLMLPTEIFNQLNGFDTYYSPAYYEDTDLAFRIRELGKKLYYQPTAVITHFEGVSNGTDTSSGIKKYQVINQKKFFDRWKDVLKSHRENAVLPEMEIDRGAKKRILIIDHRMLTPDQDSGSLRMFNIFQVIQEMGYKVTFLPDNLYAEAPYTKQLQEMGVEVIYTPYYSSVKDFLEKNGFLFDTIITSRLFVTSKNIPNLRALCPQAKIIYDTVDLHFLRELREAELTGSGKAHKKALQTKEHELSLMELAESTIVVSPYEKELLEQMDKNIDVHVVSNVHTVHGREKSYEERQDILFIGGFEHPPNVDGVNWFISEILPLVKKEIPEVRFHIIGSKPPEEIKAHANTESNIFVHGFVEDVSSYFENIKLTVAPLRYGAGVKGKVNQSLAYGVPCIATEVASEGMSLKHLQDIFVADAAEEFAAGIVKVYRDSQIWNALSDGGFENIEEHFSFEAARKSLVNCL